MTKKRIRLTIELPDNHVILAYPPGARSKAIRDMLDIATQLAAIRAELADLGCKANILSTSTVPAKTMQEKQEQSQNDVIQESLPDSPQSPNLDVEGFLSRIGVYNKEE